ncbi:hypothetical protein [Actinoallomurus sp. CA-150999]|uniref:hypothetical protein n=1 Tax=Actinoallomurus sp. CA-150999 TaxID=3239887 RepID=UPI003D8B60E0
MHGGRGVDAQGVALAAPYGLAVVERGLFGVVEVQDGAPLARPRLVVTGEVTGGRDVNEPTG